MKHCYYCDHDPKNASAETLPRCPSCGALQPAPANAMEVRSKLQTYNALSMSINGAKLVQHDDAMIVKRSPAREKPTPLGNCGYYSVGCTFTWNAELDCWMVYTPKK